jgi:hypothetical protein
MPSPSNPKAPISKKLRRDTGPRQRVKKGERESSMRVNGEEARRGGILSQNDAHGDNCGCLEKAEKGNARAAARSR